MGHGARLLGHNHPQVTKAVQAQVLKGTHDGACPALEVAWGAWVQPVIPAAERIKFTSSGTEATLMALRLARSSTGKRQVGKCAGHVHGWHDHVVVGVQPPYDGPVASGSSTRSSAAPCSAPERPAGARARAGGRSRYRRRDHRAHGGLVRHHSDQRTAALTTTS